MTRAEILDCLTDRPCDSCKFHESGRCERWDCVFEEEPDDCEDAISRAEAIEAIAKADCTDGTKAIFCGRYIVELLKDLSSATPKPKAGKWIYTKAVSTGEIIWSECSVCGEGEHGCAKRMKYCPMCGAAMEDKE